MTWALVSRDSTRDEEDGGKKTRFLPVEETRRVGRGLDTVSMETRGRNTTPRHVGNASRCQGHVRARMRTTNSSVVGRHSVRKRDSPESNDVRSIQADRRPFPRKKMDVVVPHDELRPSRPRQRRWNTKDSLLVEMQRLDASPCVGRRTSSILASHASARPTCHVHFPYLLPLLHDVHPSHLVHVSSPSCDVRFATWTVVVVVVVSESSNRSRFGFDGKDVRFRKGRLDRDEREAKGKRGEDVETSHVMRMRVASAMAKAKRAVWMASAMLWMATIVQGSVGRCLDRKRWVRRRRKAIPRDAKRR